MSSRRINLGQPPESSAAADLTVINEAMDRQNSAMSYVNSLAEPGETYGDVQNRLAGEFDEVEKAFAGTDIDYKKVTPEDFFFVQEKGRLWPIPTVISVSQNSFELVEPADTYYLSEKGALVSQEAHVSKSDMAKYAARVVVAEGATVCEDAELDEGVIVAPNARVGVKAKLGKGVILEERAQAGPKSKLKDRVRVLAGGRVGRRAKLGEGVIVEENTDVFNGMKVKPKARVTDSKVPIVNTSRTQVSLGKKLLGRSRVSTS